jgi:PAS domain S-box-containing protein
MAEDATLPPSNAARWRRMPVSFMALFMGLLIAAGVAAATVWVTLADRSRDMALEMRQLELLARVLDDQSTRAFEAVSLTLDTLARTPALRADVLDQQKASELLSNAIRLLPYARGVGLLDAHGRVIASSAADEAGLPLDLRRLQIPASAGREEIGQYISGRGLSGLRFGNAPAAPAGVGFIPVLRLVQGDDGMPRHLIVLVNPDAFASYQQLTLGSNGKRAYITSYDAKVLAASEEIDDLAGQSVAQLDIFKRFLPDREHGSYQGRGIQGDGQLVAFRTSRTRPLVSIIEEPVAVAQERWLGSAKGFLAIGGAATLLTAGLTVVIWKTIRSRERVRRLRDDAQKQVAQREEELSTLMRSLQELIFRTDAQGRITFANAKWADISGDAQEAVIGQSLVDLVEPHCREAVQSLFTPDGRPARYTQASVSTRDARYFLFDIAVVPLMADGHIAGYAGSAVNVTDRWRAQQELAAQLALSERLLETNPLPISLTSMEGKLLLVNQAWELYKGRERRHVLGETLQTFLPSDEARMHLETNRRLLNGEQRVFFEMRVQRSDGLRRDTRVIKTLVPNAQGQVAGVLSVLMDVSEFREAERATREARDALEETARAKAEFVANMSHELRTPLQSIIGFSELGVLRGQSTPKLAGMFEDIHAAGQRMLALVNDLLDVAKIESSVGSFHLENFDLRGAVRTVMHELNPLLTAKHLDLQLVLDDFPLVVKADTTRIQQVVRNIMANAIKFSPERGSIYLSLHKHSQELIEMAIADEGPGIPSNELDAIFNPFVQSSKTKDGSGGTGLGLAICKKIVEAHGGSIIAENTERGACFRVTLPARQAADTGAIPLSEA